MTSIGIGFFIFGPSHDLNCVEMKACVQKDEVKIEIIPSIISFTVLAPAHDLND